MKNRPVIYKEKISESSLLRDILISSSVRINVLLVTGIIISLFFSLSLISAADSFGGVPSSFSGNNYMVYGASINPQFNQPSFYGGYDIDVRGYWGNFNAEDCNERQDVILTIPPGGCSPSVVRSDLLEEQDVPVFCKVSSIQVNPLIDITKIRSIHFTGQYPQGIAGMSYFPARIAVRSTNELVGSPIVDNVGYLVIKLKRNPNENEMPDFITGNVTAVIDYDSEGVFGVGQQDFYLTEADDEEWQRVYEDYGFWKGKGFIRLESINEDSARISIYKDSIEREASVNLKEGETSRDLYLGGYFCAAGMNIKLESIGYPVDKVLLGVDDEELWLGKGSQFLDGRCTVSDLEIYEVGGGRARVSCTGAGKFDLILDPSDVVLGVDSGSYSEDRFSIGDKVLTTKTNIINNNIYLAYVGKFPEDNSNYVVLIKSTEESDVFLKKGLAAFIARRAETYLNSWNIVNTLKSIGDWTFGFENSLKADIHGMYPGIDKESIKILRAGESWNGVTLVSKYLPETQLDNNKLLKDNYEGAVKNYEEVFNLYPTEKTETSKDTYAAEALYNAAILSQKLGLQNKQIEYLEKLTENYQDTGLAKTAEIELERAYESKFSANSQAIVYVNNEPHFVSFLDAKKPSYEDLGAKLEFTVNGKISSLEMKKDVRQLIPNTDPKAEVPFEITEINDDSVTINYYPPESGLVNAVVDKLGKITVGKDIKGETMNLEMGKLTQLTKGINVRLVDTNLNKMAKVQIIPRDFGMRTESTFNFGVGIEKRGIKLSPEKTKEMISNLDETIKKWGDINEKLGKVVTGMKGACFATSAVLVVKNFFSGLSGEAMARNEIMTGEGGWNDKCRQWSGVTGTKSPYTGKTYSSVQTCLLDHNDEINNAVSQYKTIIENENNNIKGIENLPGVKQEGDILDWQGQVDQEKLKEQYCEKYFKNAYNPDAIVSIKGVGDVTLKEVIDSKRAESCDVNLEDMKMIVLKSQIDKTSDSVLKEVVDNRLKSGLRNTYDITQLTQDETAIKNEVNGFTSSAPVLGIESGKSIVTEMHTLTSTEKSGFPSDVSKVAYYKIPENSKYGTASNQYVAVGFKKESSTQHSVESVNIIDNGKLGQDVKEDFLKFLGDQKISSNNFVEANSGLYKNKMKGNPIVKYYERAPYQGLPALVPFDKENGWYVTTDYILSGFGKPYEENGRAVNFWICNVGNDGLIDGKGKDDCRYYNLGSAADLKFPGLSGSESAVLVSKAERAIRDTSSQYGKSKVTVNNQVFDTGIAENGESGNCADFMSPNDCNLLFNVCDPVMCPESRCDFGGKYRVDNVIQSGIIGSLLLCLPNANEGIAIPVCLSGVHAGIEGYLSILKSTQQCLNESLVTGQNIGICDEIKSVYMCEFFWKQATPLIDIAIPSVFEALTGQGARGGGEYLTVDYAWKNVQNSIDYFKNEYAVNAMKAFNERSTAGVGEEVCKSFVSATYPNGDLIGNLLEPDSPVQYTAWFSEDSLTEATIPPTSHYKVYYHIYAGKNFGASYVVYLKNPPESGMVHTLETYVVDRGYLPVGQQVDNARDFTGISGYTQLCISINGQDDCGFKQITTSWAINQLANQYASEQATDRVTKTSECISGQPSIYSLANPNLQAGVQETISPELYKKGVIRVCSSENPGKSVTPSGVIDPTNSSFDRWVRVGDCDSSAVGCWLDTESVKDVLSESPDLLNHTLSEVKLDYADKLEDLTPEDIQTANSHANFIQDNIKAWDTSSFDEASINEKIGGVIEELKAVEERGGADNIQKARALFNIGIIYDEIARKIYEEVVVRNKITSNGETYNNDNLKQGVWIIWKYTETETTGTGMGAGGYGSKVVIKDCSYKFDGKWEISPESQRCLSANVAGVYVEGIGKIAEFVLRQAEAYKEVEIEGATIRGDNADKLKLQILERLKYLKDNENTGSGSSQTTREKWTWDTAKSKINALTGKYSENKEFIDQLCEDSLLNSSQCTQIKNNDSTIDIIKNLLLQNELAANRD